MPSVTYRGVNAGGGHRAVAEHIKSQHNGAGRSGNAVSGMMKPARRSQPGAPASVLKTPRRSHSKSSGQMS